MCPVGLRKMHLFWLVNISSMVIDFATIPMVSHGSMRFTVTGLEMETVSSQQRPYPRCIFGFTISNHQTDADGLIHEFWEGKPTRIVGMRGARRGGIKQDFHLIKHDMVKYAIIEDRYLVRTSKWERCEKWDESWEVRHFFAAFISRQIHFNCRQLFSVPLVPQFPITTWFY